MPINAYTGLMGSGKSYECVSAVIVPAIAEGRRVVTNVDGIDSDAVRAYVHEKRGIPMEKLGSVVHCTNEQVTADSFFPHGTEAETFCKGGDLVCIDEAWRFWGTDCKLSANHKIFFREHRHYVNPETKVSCDLVLMVQDISDLHRTLKVVVELSFRTTKIKSLGMSKVYRVEMWEGYKQTTRSRVSVQNKSYSKEIFPLYSSYTGGKGKELTVDDRQNILKNPWIWITAVLMIIVASVSAFYLKKFFNPQVKEQSKTLDGAKAGGAGAPAGGGVVQPVEPKPEFSDTWRIAGKVRVDGKEFVLLTSNAGLFRYEVPENFRNEGRAMIGTLDGRKVTFYSGSPERVAPGQTSGKGEGK
jgi:zona occludens toxin